MAAISEALATALQHHQAGRWQAAEQIYRGILEVDPKQPDAYHLLGVLAHEMGQPEMAIEYIGRAIRLKGTVSAFHNNLGEVLRAIGRMPEAEACYRRALSLQRNSAGAHNNLGNVLREQHKLDQAIVSYRKALKLKPRFAEAHNNLGNALKDLGKLDLAIASYRRAIDAKPDYAKAHFSLGTALKEQGLSEAAVACFRRALELKPDFAEAHNNLGNVFWEQRKLAEAETCCRQALQFKPEWSEALSNLGNVLRTQGRLDEAMNCYRRALQINPDLAEAHGNLADALVECGQLLEAEAGFQRAIQLQPQFARAYSGLAMLLRGNLPDDHLAALENQLTNGRLTDSLRAELSFSLAHVLDARGDYARAAECLRRANELRLKLAPMPYSRATHENFVSGLTQAFDGGFFARLADKGSDSRQPVFVFGLPRSGTTLIEQILASHSQVRGAGELELAHKSFEGLPVVLKRAGESMDCVPLLDQAALQCLAQQHLDQLTARDHRGALRIVDKMPENYLYLGLLAAMFPRATFIHCRRDLRDVAVSCWMTDFIDVRWANAPEDIIARFQQYQRIMEHWRKVLPITIHDVAYEDTIADLEGVARRLVLACGLEWEPACLEFHRTVRPIRTASVSQVRQPLYRKSLGRWKHYEFALAEMLGQLPPNSAIQIGSAGHSRTENAIP